MSDKIIMPPGFQRTPMRNTPQISQPMPPKLIVPPGLGHGAQDDQAKLQAAAEHKLRFLVARIEKSIGKNVEQRVLLAAIVVLLAKVIGYSPRQVHNEMLMDVLRTTATLLQAAHGPLPPEQPANSSVEPVPEMTADDL